MLQWLAPSTHQAASLEQTPSLSSLSSLSLSLLLSFFLSLSLSVSKMSWVLSFFTITCSEQRELTCNREGEREGEEGRETQIESR